jgi:hypothetical protein
MHASIHACAIAGHDGLQHLAALPSLQQLDMSGTLSSLPPGCCMLRLTALDMSRPATILKVLSRVWFGVFGVTMFIILHASAAQCWLGSLHQQLPEYLWSIICVKGITFCLCAPGSTSSSLLPGLAGAPCQWLGQGHEGICPHLTGYARR